MPKSLIGSTRAISSLSNKYLAYNRCGQGLSNLNKVFDLEVIHNPKTVKQRKSFLGHRQTEDILHSLKDRSQDGWVTNH